MYYVSVEWINDIYKYLWVISIIIRYWGFVHHFTQLTYYFFINLLCFFSLPFHSVTHFQQLPCMLFSFCPAPPTLPSNEAGRKWQTLLWYYPFFHLCYASLGIKGKCLSIAGMGNPVSNNRHQCLNFYVFTYWGRIPWGNEKMILTGHQRKNSRMLPTSACYLF